jgi:hypothetical protein
VLRCAVLCCDLLCCPVLCCPVLCCPVLCCAELRGPVETDYLSSLNDCTHSGPSPMPYTVRGASARARSLPSAVSIGGSLVVCLPCNNAGHCCRAIPAADEAAVDDWHAPTRHCKRALRPGPPHRSQNALPGLPSLTRRRLPPTHPSPAPIYPAGAG